MKKMMIHGFPITKIILRRRKLSPVRILPKAAVQENKATLGGTLAFHMFFQGKKPAPFALIFVVSTCTAEL